MTTPVVVIDAENATVPASRRLPVALVACVWTYFGIFVAWRLSSWGSASTRALVTDAALIVPAIPAIASAMLAARRCDDARTASAWRWLAASITLVSGDFIADFCYQAVDGAVPFPSVADGFLLSFYPVFLIGLLRFPTRSESSAGKLRVSIDVAMTVLCGVSVIWFLVLGPTVTTSDHLLDGVVAGALTLGDMLQIFGLTYLLTRLVDPSTQRALGFLVASALVMIVGDLTVGWMTLHDQLWLSALVDITFMAWWTLFILAGAAQGPSHHAASQPARADGDAVPTGAAGRVGALAYLTPAVVFGLLVFVQFDGTFAERVTLAVGAALVSILVLLRQFLAHRDLLSAQDALASSNEQLHQMIATRQHAEDERDRMERELRLSQKLESVGQLAAGIAHEINTPIQYVSSSVEFLDTAFADITTLQDAYATLRDAAALGVVDAELLAGIGEAEELADLDYLRERVPAALERSLDGLARVAKIVGAMREFGHPPTTGTVPVDVNAAIENTLVVTANEYKYVADLTTDLGDIPLVMSNGGDINQVLINLIVNASHAIGDVVQGTEQRGAIHIRTCVEDDHAVITIADTGGGIPPEIAERVFDPFFTTKSVGHGTGQGLAIARAIIDRHEGTLTFDTPPGQGTTFTIRLQLDPSAVPTTA
ncbi:MAG: two-component system, NtrC family, sensor kinase [Solirubrobacteraceae bacterium]|jgi:signal transduction histidine kinase|nr:two-component system, NtrC family, sensor kinase [Solirubrobacteraceae bacterium]